MLRSRMGVLALVLAGLLAGCAFRNAPAGEPELSEIVLHLDFRGGGDAPHSILFTFYEGGEVRLYTARRKIYWSSLKPHDSQKLRSLLRSPEFLRELETLNARPHRFACCDIEEVGIYLGVGSKAVSLKHNEDLSQLSQVAEWAHFVDSIGDEYFGRRYSMKIVP